MSTKQVMFLALGVGLLACKITEKVMERFGGNFHGMLTIAQGKVYSFWWSI